MFTVQPIRTDDDLETARRRIARIADAKPGTQEYDEHSVLSVLVGHYESQHHQDHPADPIASIQAHMDREGLTQRDLIPIIGSRSKVSAILSGKRQLTFAMARALHRHLGIPAELLLSEPSQPQAADGSEPDWNRYPIKDMEKRDWIEKNSGKSAKEIITKLKSDAGGYDLPDAFYRKNDHLRMNAKTNLYAIQAWCWQVLAQANENRPLTGAYVEGSVNEDFMREIGQLSRFADGPVRAQRRLRERGIGMEIVYHLPRTYLDGAAIRPIGCPPVIGLTLRYDRVDNFWFTLMHELAHVSHDLGDSARDTVYVDDLSLSGEHYERTLEGQADRTARDTLIPPDIWENRLVREDPTAVAVMELAQEIQVHPAVIAGRIRYDSQDWRRLSQLVGSGKIRSQFS